MIAEPAAAAVARLANARIEPPARFAGIGVERQDLVAQRAAIYRVADLDRRILGADRPELLRMVVDLQPGEVVVAEKINRISRLPLPEAELLVATIRGKGLG